MLFRRPVDTTYRHCHGGTLTRLSVDVYEAEPEIIDQRGEKRCFIHAKKASVHGNVVRKFKSVALMLLASVPPSEACRPPAPNGSTDSESEKKNRAAILSCAPRNSRSQLAVNCRRYTSPATDDQRSTIQSNLAGIRIDADARGSRNRGD